MAGSVHTPRKSSQEIEIDHLLAEEFSCDPKFSARFATACGLRFETLRVLEAVAEPSLGGEGYGDLLVKAEMDGSRIAVLIEDKITAGAGHRQAERYAAHADRMRHEGWNRVLTVLVAPRAYRGERGRYDITIDLESVAEFLDSPDPARRDYRRKIIERALKKKAKTGVKNPDIAMHRLHSDYLTWFEKRCGREGLEYSFPGIRPKYYDGHSWIEPIRASGFPEHISFRHRLWTGGEDATGMVDLIIDSNLPLSELERLETWKPERANVGPFGKDRIGRPPGTQVSIKVPEIRQSSGFCEASAAEAFNAMKLLARLVVKLQHLQER